MELAKLTDAYGKDIDVSGVKFGSTSSQKVNNTVKLDTTAYKWNGTELQNAVGGSKVFDLAELFDAAATVDDPKLADTDEGKAALAALAKAYGYEGSERNS